MILEHAFGIAYHSESLGIDLGDEQRSAMAKDMIVVRTSSCVGEKESFVLRVRHPILLGIVASERLAVIKAPFCDAVR
jgi:hypothetical protein